MLTTRMQTPELMDDPDLPTTPHRAALRGLNRVNWVSGTANRLWNALAPYVDPKRGIRVLDVGSGGGDVLCKLAQTAIRANIPFEAVGCDISATACEYARENSYRLLSKQYHGSIQFLETNFLQDELPKDFDVAYCSLVLHHLNETEAIQLLEGLKTASGRAVLVDDLRRSVPGYALAWIGTRLLSGSRIVHVDGPLSVKAAFTVTEAMELAKAADMNAAKITSHWPFRFLLHWKHA